MSRRVTTAQMRAGVAAPTAPGVDGFFDKLLKYIPADVNAGWVAVTGILASMTAANKTWGWILFVIFILLAGLWTWKQTNQPGQPAARWQILIAALAFIVWVFALGGPFKDLPWWSTQLGAIVLIIFTLVAPLFPPD